MFQIVFKLGCFKVENRYLIDTAALDQTSYYLEAGSKSQCLGLDWSGIWGQGEQEECNSCVLLSLYLCWDTSVSVIVSVLSSHSVIYIEYIFHFKIVEICADCIYILKSIILLKMVLIQYSSRNTLKMFRGRVKTSIFLYFEAFRKQPTSRWVIILISCQ